MSSSLSPRFLIVAAGSIDKTELPIQKEPGDFLCASDGGYLALAEAGQLPDLLIGDFDSMAEPDIACETIRLPVEKDDTDTVYCVKEGFARGYTDFLIYGALGGERLSHTMANISLLSMIRKRGGRGELRAKQTRVLLLVAGERISLSPEGSGFISLFSLTEEAELSASGLSYPLAHTILSRSFPLGVSNRFSGAYAELTVHSGEALVILD